MNEYNHHRIIKRVVSDLLGEGKKLPQNIENVFIDASNFSDTIFDFFLCHFYYDINISGSDTIQLSRADQTEDFINKKALPSMKRCDSDSFSSRHPVLSKISLPFAPPPVNVGLTEEVLYGVKRFFSIINDRPEPHINDKIGNQSDNVAFLHAMGAELGNGLSEKPARSRAVFEEHLKKCFAEYLFLKDENKALFMLGIAMHGIMDSFTPSHMNFQHYTKQDMALHAQGDVVPILDSEDKVEFVPGQYKEDRWYGELLSNMVKGFDGGDTINNCEYEMLRIYLDICKLKSKSKEMASFVDNNGGNNICGENLVSYATGGDFINGDDIWNKLKQKNKKYIDDKLSEYEYAPEAYIYSNAAIETIKDIYLYLSRKRKGIPKRNIYQTYKNNKKDILKTALQKWQNKYDELEPVRKAHLDRDFYSHKVSFFDKWAFFEQVKEQAKKISESTASRADRNIYFGGSKY